MSIPDSAPILPREQRSDAAYRALDRGFSAGCWLMTLQQRACGKCDWRSAIRLFYGTVYRSK